MTTTTSFAGLVGALIETAKARAADGLSVADFAELALGICRAAIQAADGLALPGRDKKAWVLEAVGATFDAIADRMIPIVLWPLWLVLRPAARALVLAAAGGAVEILLPLVRNAP